MTDSGLKDVVRAVVMALVCVAFLGIACATMSKSMLKPKTLILKSADGTTEKYKVMDYCPRLHGIKFRDADTGKVIVWEGEYKLEEN